MLHRVMAQQVHGFSAQGASLLKCGQWTGGAHAADACMAYLLAKGTHCPFPNLQVVLAQQMYDYVDAKIRMLDADLRRFDAELAQDRRRAGLPVSLVLTDLVGSGCRVGSWRGLFVGVGDQRRHHNGQRLVCRQGREWPWRAYHQNLQAVQRGGAGLPTSLGVLQYSVEAFVWGLLRCPANIAAAGSANIAAAGLPAPLHRLMTLKGLAPSMPCSWPTAWETGWFCKTISDHSPSCKATIPPAPSLTTSRWL